ncbi:MAG: translation elongation factor Ts [Kiritimatiellae bacterium]|nr:translation elongation factor Ts [Kiritimatiellia bacterium]
MVEITATLVKELRDETGVGMMECKRALVDAGGDKAKAFQLLRERGVAVAAKKSAREVKSGLIAARTFQNGRMGAMVEVACETDFVARNDLFQSFVAGMVDRAAQCEGELAPAVSDEVNAAIQKIGENIIVRRNARYVRQGEGLVGTYVHLGSKLGVMIELGATKPETAAQPAVQELVRDLALHLAANRPPYLDRSAIPADVIENERGIFAKQVEGKPANIIEKIVAGKLEKFYATVCFVEQPFVKDPDQTVQARIDTTSKACGDALTARRFVIFQLGQ